MQITKNKILQRLILFLTIGFIILTVFISFFPTSVLDIKFSDEVQEHQNPMLDQFMKLISWFGNVPISLYMALITAFLFFIFKYRREALFVLLTLTSGIVSSGLKFLINRPRPTKSLVRIIEHAKQQSFPSGHTLFYVVFFGFLMLLMYLLKTIPVYIRLTVTIVCAGMIFFVPFSRIYLGAHWFTDVLGGFIMGLICLYLLSHLYLKRRSS
jgi:membrane-associated phospholipid phosphatase